MPLKTSECDILIIPGWQNSGPNHWQSRWEAKLPTARRVEQRDWDRPDKDAWVSAIGLAVNAATRPVILVAHSLGVAAVIHAAPYIGRSVRGAFLVGLPDVDRDDMPGEVTGFAGLSTDPLPFPSMLVASRTDPYCAFDRAGDFAAAWGSDFIDAGDSGHLNSESGHGPWPEGLTRFATLLKRV
ncbi:RBBP9/YdeN family alpha/beta hydrolase [Oryzibacter oryziterrae]|uniref:RBBP9/YdeN family alpha/beta hydrolase n=1 Tax=Oryzibacter oryziterrae TaxID=2766474 RepID=UPI001F324827|nr:alpha/beta hydrolase [Oryzibacter oryziterrae]